MANPILTPEELLEVCTSGKGRIVCSGDLTEGQIVEARKHGCFYANEAGLGFAFLPWELSTKKDAAREQERGRSTATMAIPAVPDWSKTGSLQPMLEEIRAAVTEVRVDLIKLDRRLTAKVEGIETNEDELRAVMDGSIELFNDLCNFLGITVEQRRQYASEAWDNLRIRWGKEVHADALLQFAAEVSLELRSEPEKPEPGTESKL